MEADYPGCWETIRQAYIRKNINLECLPVFMNSLSKNTLKQYNTSFSKWWRFCVTNSIAIFNPSLNDVLMFLNTEFSAGAAYQTLNCHRSALKQLFYIEDKDNIIKRFLKGTFRMKPVFPKYNQTWDPKIVINYLSTFFPSNTLPLAKLTHKLITLMALVTSHRVQTFSLIKISNITKCNDSFRIFVDAFLKTSSPNRPQPILEIPKFTEKPEICVASTLEEYLITTKALRGNIQELFITYKKPFRKASVQTLSRWIKTVLQESGVDTSIYSGHSTRHASTSAAFQRGVDIETIRKAAGWTPNSSSFARFYCRPVLTTSLYASQVILSK